MKPYCVIYSSFAQRAYDEIIHDIALQHLNVVLCLDRAGLVGEDGATHQGAFDMASLRCIPGTVIAAPKDETELKRLLYTGLDIKEGPFVIRYPRGLGEGSDWRNARRHHLRSARVRDCPTERRSRSWPWVLWSTGRRRPLKRSGRRPEGDPQYSMSGSSSRSTSPSWKRRCGSGTS